MQAWIDAIQAVPDLLIELLQYWADTLRQAQLDVLSASAGAVTLAAPTEEAVYAEEGADAVDGVGEGFGGRVRGASTASETGVPETAGDVAQQC